MIAASQKGSLGMVMN